MAIEKSSVVKVNSQTLDRLKSMKEATGMTITGLVTMLTNEWIEKKGEQYGISMDK